MGGTVSRFDFIDAARSVGERFAALVRDTDSPDVRVASRNGWTLTDCVGHVASEPSRYLELARGESEWPCHPKNLAEIYAKQIANLPTRDPAMLADKLLSDLDDLLDAVRHFGARVPMMNVAGDHRVRADAALGILIGEMAVRGRDIADALGAHWTIDPQIAPLVTRGRHQLIRPWLDQQDTQGHTATYEVRLRHTGERFTYEFTDGSLEVGPREPRRPDVYISVEPVAFVLALHGRLSPFGAMCSGRAFAWGPKPWLALTLRRRLTGDLRVSN